MVNPDHTHVSASGTIPAQEVTVDEMKTVDASMYFSDNTGATYAATSDMPMYATVMTDANSGMVTITGVAEGTAMITVTATSGAVEATQTFEVEVKAAALGPPTGVMAMIDEMDPALDDIVVTWTDGANADVHHVYLVPIDFDFANIRNERITSGGTHTFMDRGAGYVHRRRAVHVARDHWLRVRYRPRPHHGRRPVRQRKKAPSVLKERPNAPAESPGPSLALRQS